MRFTESSGFEVEGPPAAEYAAASLRATPLTTRPLDAEDLAAVRELVGLLGLSEASRRLGLPQSTLAAAAAGARMRAGNVALYSQRIRAAKEAAKR